MKKQFLLIVVSSLLSYNLFASDWIVDGNSYGWQYDLSLSSTRLGNGANFSGEQATFKNIFVDRLSGTRLIIDSPTSKLVLENATLSLDGNYSFTQGVLEIKGNCEIIGSGETFTFNGHRIIIHQNSSLKIKGITFNSAPTSKIIDLIHFGNSSSELILENSTLNIDNLALLTPTTTYTDGNGILLINGNLVIEGSSIIDNSYTATMAALVLGNNAYSSADCKLKINPNSKLTVKKAGIIFKNVGSGSLDLSGGSGNLNIESGAHFTLEPTVDLGGDSLNFDFENMTGITKSIFSEALESVYTETKHGTAGVRAVKWSFDGRYLAMGGHTGIPNAEIRVFAYNGSSLNAISGCNMQHGDDPVWDVDWHPSFKYLAIVATKYASPTGPITQRVYTFNNSYGSETLTNITGCEGYHGNTVSMIDWSPCGKYLAIGGVGVSSVTTRVYSFDGVSTTTLSGCNKNHGATVNSVSWSPDGRYLAVGGSSSSSITHRIYSFNGTTLTELTGCNQNHGAAVASVVWSPCGKYLAVGGSLSGVVTHSVYEFDGNSLTELIGCRANLGGNNVVDICWNPDGKYLLVGSGWDVGGYTNSIYRFDGISLTELTSTRQLLLSNRAVDWSRNGKVIVIAGFFVGVHLDILATNLVFGGAQEVSKFQNGKIALGQDLNLVSQTLTLSDITVDGFGKTLTLGAGGYVSLCGGDGVTFDNVNISGLKSGNLSCFDNTASVTLKNSNLILSHDFTFSTGLISFEGDVVLTGTNKFCYATSKASNIAVQSTLFIDRNVTFSYDPPVASKTLLGMSDATSKLYAKWCTIHSTHTGLKLDNGKLIIEDDVTIESEADVSAEAIEFGPNLSVDILAGGKISLDGMLKYN